jgi:predicted nucleotidyltransferase
MGIKLQLPLAPENRLVRWANAISAFYGFPVYLVGSQLTKDNPRDVDVCVVLPDDVFEVRYGNVDKWIDEGASGLYSELRWGWADDVVKKCMHGREATKLEIDLKVIPEKYDKEHYKDLSKYRLDTRPQ